MEGHEKSSREDHAAGTEGEGLWRLALTRAVKEVNTEQPLRSEEEPGSQVENRLTQRGRSSSVPRALLHQTR